MPMMNRVSRRIIIAWPAGLLYNWPVRTRRHIITITTRLVVFALLVQPVLASACHSLGDVHVICRDGGTSAIIVQNDTVPAELSERETCCAAVSLPPIDGTALAAAPDDLSAVFVIPIWHRHKQRSDAAAEPRAPPALLFSGTYFSRKDLIDDTGYTYALGTLRRAAEL